MAFKVNKKKFKESYEEYETKQNQDGTYSDPDFWTLKINKDTKVGRAKIRLLPLGGLSDISGSVPWVVAREYNFKMKNGRIFKEYAPFVKNDPLWEIRQRMWEEDEDLARTMYPKKCYFHNILVIKEMSADANKDNEGRVFKFKFGKQIYEILKGNLDPSKEDREEGIVPLYYFCSEEGADFSIKTFNQGGFPNYTSSKFLDPSPIKKETHHLTADEIEQLLFTADELFNAEKMIKPDKDIIKKYLEMAESKPNTASNTTSTSAKKEDKKEEYDEDLNDEDLIDDLMEDDD